MPTRNIRSLAQMREVARERGPKRVAVVVADDEIALTAAAGAVKLGLARPVLIGDEKAISSKIAALHLDALVSGAEIVATDFGPESGAQATRELLSGPEPPTAIVYDSDLLAVTGLGVAHQMGLSVPGDVSIVAGDDSLMCEVVHPSLTAVTRDIPAYGAAAAKQLLAAIDGKSPEDVETPRGMLTPRGSTGPAPVSAQP